MANRSAKMTYLYQDDTDQSSPLKCGAEDVGVYMSAKLKQTSTLLGKNTSINDKIQSGIMRSLKVNFNSEKFIRGHLLNACLGGHITNENLFPITSAANSEHSRTVEEPIKKIVCNMPEIGNFTTKNDVYLHEILQNQYTSTDLQKQQAYINNIKINQGASCKDFFPITYSVELIASEPLSSHDPNAFLYCECKTNNGTTIIETIINSKAKGKNIFYETVDIDLFASKKNDIIANVYQASQVPTTRSSSSKNDEIYKVTKKYITKIEQSVILQKIDTFITLHKNIFKILDAYIDTYEQQVANRDPQKIAVSDMINQAIQGTVPQQSAITGISNGLQKMAAFNNI